MTVAYERIGRSRDLELIDYSREFLSRIPAVSLAISSGPMKNPLPITRCAVHLVLKLTLPHGQSRGLSKYWGLSFPIKLSAKPALKITSDLPPCASLVIGCSSTSPVNENNCQIRFEQVIVASAFPLLRAIQTVQFCGHDVDIHNSGIVMRMRKACVSLAAVSWTLALVMERPSN